MHVGREISNVRDIALEKKQDLVDVWQCKV